jgi:hypothetical protein
MRTALYMSMISVIIIGAIFMSYHIWSDCLEENSFFTCSRMLTK